MRRISLTLSEYLSTVMQIEEALLNDYLGVSDVS